MSESFKQYKAIAHKVDQIVAFCNDLGVYKTTSEVIDFLDGKKVTQPTVLAESPVFEEMAKARKANKARKAKARRSRGIPNYLRWENLDQQHLNSLRSGQIVNLTVAEVKHFLGDQISKNAEEKVLMKRLRSHMHNVARTSGYQASCTLFTDHKSLVIFWVPMSKTAVQEASSAE